MISNLNKKVSRFLGSLVVVLCLVSLAACSTDSFVAHPLGGGQYLVQRSLSNPHAWAATPQTNWLETCAGKEKHYPQGTDGLDLFDCKSAGGYWYTQQTGYLSGILAPALQAGGMIGAGALVGDGLKHSGSTTSSNSTTNATTSSSTSVNVRSGH